MRHDLVGFSMHRLVSTQQATITASRVQSIVSTQYRELHCPQLNLHTMHTKIRVHSTTSTPIYRYQCLSYIGWSVTLTQIEELIVEYFNTWILWIDGNNNSKSIESGDIIRLLRWTLSSHITAEPDSLPDERLPEEPRSRGSITGFVC